MNKISIYSGGYPVDLFGVKKTVNKTLKDQKIPMLVEVSINFVDDKVMAGLHRKYMHQVGTTDVLSFPLNEARLNKKTKNIFIKINGFLNLGDLVISYEQARKQSKEHALEVNDEINKLVEHGLLHLLGIHHK
jgi:probable rRNA maturation factor